MKRGTVDRPATDDAKAVGDAIYELRAHKSRRWSQRDLARQMGMANSTVYGWEMGWTKPSHRAIHALCTVFGITRDEFGQRVQRCRREIETSHLQTTDRCLDIREQQTADMKRWWVSWWSPALTMPPTSSVPFQFWTTGEREGDSGEEELSLIAVIDSPSVLAIWDAIGKLFSVSEQRFCNLRAADWTPGDRFVNFENRTAIKFDQPPLKRFLISWWTLPELMPKQEDVPFQFWETLATTESLSNVLVSYVTTVINAESDTQAWAAIGVYFKPSLPTTFEEKPMGWVPEGDRFVGFENRTAIKFDATA